MPSNSLAAIFEVQPIGTRMLLSAESPLILAAIELLLGGSLDSSGGIKERRMTDIDQALGRHFFERLLAQLTLIWTDVAGLELKLEAVDAHLETAQMVSVSEPTMELMLEARMQGMSAMLALLIPWSAIAPVADQFGAREDATGVQNEDDANSVRRAVGNVEMTVRAEVAAVQMPIESVLALKEGDLLRLTRPRRPGSRCSPTRCRCTSGARGAAAAAAPSRSSALRGMSDERQGRPGRLGQSSAEACLGVLEMFAPGKCSAGDVTVSDDVKAAFGGMPVPAVAMSVSYVDGVTGGNVFLVTLDGARRLAAAMMGMEEPTRRRPPSCPSSSSPPCRRR